MNYAHAYHAGNFADVVKHVLLLELLHFLTQKQKPFYVLDAYGGRGLYSLASLEAKKTQEAEKGIKALLAQLSPAGQAAKTSAEPAAKSSAPIKMPRAVEQYVSQMRFAQSFYDQYVYPGSPWWIANHVDQHPELAIRAEAFEAKASEYEGLHFQLFQLPIGIHRRDAFEGVKAVIPPKEKRGLIFLDPPYEQEHKDFTRLVELLSQAHQKWPQGVYALWYPLKNQEAVSVFHKKMKRTEIPKQLVCELNIYPNDVPVGLNGTGMLIINPPWQFDNHAAEILHFLQPLLAPADAPSMPLSQSCRVTWLTKER